MQPCQTEKKEDKDIIVLPISFGNPSNEIIHGELRLSLNEQHSNKTVAIIGIPTEIDLKEMFAFFQKSKASLKMTHIKILNQEHSKNNNTNPSESYYCTLCSFSSTSHSQLFIKHLNGQLFNAQLTDHKSCIYYLVNSIIIINKQILPSNPINPKQENSDNEHDDDHHQKMHFPPTRITTAHLIKQNSSYSNNNNDEDIANCAFCFDSVEPPLFTPQSSPNKSYSVTPFITSISSPLQLLHRDNSDPTFKLFPSPYKNDETPSLSSSPPPSLTNMDDPKWYDNDNTVCFVLCGHFFHVMCLMRCEQNSCPICRHYLFPESSSICNSCNLCTKDLWVCLTCGHIGCGRFNNQCAVKHYNVTSHIWSKCLTTSDVWDYADDDYVYRILMAEIDNSNNTKMVSLQTSNNDGIDGSTKHLPLELDIMSSVKQEEFIYEYNFEVQNRLKRLQTFHKTKMNRMKKNGLNEINKLVNDIKKNEKEIIIKTKNNDKLFGKYKEKYIDDECIEFVNDMEYLRKQLDSERNRGDKLRKMIHNVFVEQKTFNSKLKEYEDRLKQSLSMTESTLNVEINRMKNELRDYKAHIDTSLKMKKAATQKEIDTSSITVKPGKSKNNQKREMKNKPHSNKKTKKSRKNRK